MKNFRRLIEVDFPIKQASDYARTEKNMRSGHPWHLHIWWARRPWGACRSVALASLLPAPAHESCPRNFITECAKILTRIGFRPEADEPGAVQKALLDFVGRASEWEAGAHDELRRAARDLVAAAYPDSTPVAFDPFSGYGAIPGEAARLGCISLATDLNPVALLCLRTLLESVPKHGHEMIDLFHEGALYVRKHAEQRLRKYYPQHEKKDPIAWLWARTVQCQGPGGCGAEIPVISQTSISKTARKAWIEITPEKTSRKVCVEVKSGKTVPAGLMKTAGGRSSVVCPICGTTTDAAKVKKQGMNRAISHRVYGVAMPVGERQGKSYHTARDEDVAAVGLAAEAWERVVKENPDADLTEKYPFHDTRAFTAGSYGVRTWGDLFSPRQKLACYTLGKILADYEQELLQRGINRELTRSVVTALALSISNTSHYMTNMSTWLSEGMISCFIAGNAIAMRWDWAEANPLVETYAGGLDFSFSKSEEGLRAIIALRNSSTTVTRADAANLPHPDDSADLFFTDPPYYDVVPYADLSDVCYVWLRRLVGHLHRDLLSGDLTPKAEQIVMNPYSKEDGRGEQSAEYYQRQLTKAFSEARRVLKPDGIGCIVFAHKGTAAWEALLAAIIDANFIVTASWPIDTERAARMRANKSAALGSSVHIVVRPRESIEGAPDLHSVGDWRDVLAELPDRIREWMGRLINEGIVGADAIFACLGPALEIYSRYSRVEKSNGEQVFLREYLEHVWSTISREALRTLFQDADMSGLEADARLTAMWLWTLKTDVQETKQQEELVADDEAATDEEEKGYPLEFDAVNNIAKGLGVHLEDLHSAVEVSKGKARLLAVSERATYLFGKSQSLATPINKPKGKQLDMFAAMSGGKDEQMPEIDDVSLTKPGETTLDRVHQAMLLFGTGRGEAMRRFLVESGAGSSASFWKLLNALSALYPSGSQEKRWVDGVLARKKGLGL